MNKEKLTIQNYVGEVRICFGNITDNIIRIGELYCEALKKYSNAKKVFGLEFKNVRPQTWEKFRKIGEHKLAASALFLPDTLATKLVKANVSVEKQEKLITAVGVKVFRKDEKKEVIVPFQDFTSDDEEVFFDTKAGNVRSVEEQKKFVKETKAVSIPMWEVIDGGIKVNRAGFIPWADLDKAFKGVKGEEK